MAPRDPRLRRDVLERQALFLARGAQPLADGGDLRLNRIVYRFVGRFDHCLPFFTCHSRATFEGCSRSVNCRVRASRGCPD